MSDNKTPDYGFCKHCGGEIAIRNPTGRCDHLYWPNMLTDEAKRVNGFRPARRQVLELKPDDRDKPWTNNDPERGCVGDYDRTGYIGRNRK